MSFAATVARALPISLKTAIHRRRGWHQLAMSLYGTLVGSTPHAVLTGPLAGVWLVPGQHVSHAHLRGTYEQDIQACLDRLVQPGMLCYDVGASIGYFSLQMALKARHVYAFEPSPVALHVMGEQLRVNPELPITVIPQPVSRTRDVVRFCVTQTAYGSGIHDTIADWPVLPMEAVTLDAFAADHPAPDVLKIDVEGAELAVLDGARALIERHHPAICCEVHSADLARSVAAWLLERGYRLTMPTGAPFVPPQGAVIAGDLHVIATH